jgi:basic amino acid/polyamine antiporter, APA family
MSASSKQLSNTLVDSTASAPVIRLRGNIGFFQFLALGFGTIIGSAWVILLGDWLIKAGPGGAIVGFVCGGAVMVVVGACYAELTTLIPHVGSEFIYAYEVYGRRVAFVVGWFLALYLVCVTIFEGLALAWIVEVALPSWQSSAAQGVFATKVSSLGISVGVACALTILGLNYCSARRAVLLHSVLTYGFLATVLVVLSDLLAHGRLGNALPAFVTMNDAPWWVGSAAIFAFGAYAFTGFQTIPQAIEERSEHISLRSVASAIVASITVAAVFYCLVVLCVSIARPWRSLITTPFPVVTATLFLRQGHVLATALLAATVASLFKTWNGIFMTAARLLVAMARVGFLPPRIARLDGRFQSPAAALVIVAVLNICGLFLGKAAIQPIADMASMMLTLAYLMCCATVLLMRKQGKVGQYRVPGGIPIIAAGGVGAGIMAAAALLTPFWEQKGKVPLEWKLLGVWSLFGIAIWYGWVRRRSSIQV